MLHVDMPTVQDLKNLRAVRADACVSLYVPTTPITPEIDASRIELSNLVKQAIADLEEAGHDDRRLAALSDALDDLLDDSGFWSFQARSLAVLATPDSLRTFRLANRLQSRVEVADRFHLKPLLRAVTFPHEAFVLVLSENSARLVEIFPDLPPQEVEVPGLPEGAASVVPTSSASESTSLRRTVAPDDRKVRLTQYARAVDAAIRPILAGRDAPLILAANEPLASLFRSVNSHTDLLPETIHGLSDRSGSADVAEQARPVLDRTYAEQIEQVKERFEQRAGSGRAITDVADAARAATIGAIETLLVDLDDSTYGTVDEETGAVTFGDEGPDTYSVVDEIMGRAMDTGARVLAARRADIPGAGPLAATLRYTL